MGISHDIISEFVKITNDKKEKPKEETVYATIVQASDGKYVKIDGSDLITPTETTTDIEEGERVTVLIKDHSAIITGNITSPSASANRVNGIVDIVNEKLGVFEIIVADKIDVNELNAYKATIENLIVGKAEIEDLKATRAEIEFLDADVAHIKTLVNGNLTSDNILSFNITADKVTMADAFIKDAMVDTINAAKINAGRINTNNVVIGSDDGGMLISGATQQFTDKNGKVRIQIGRDSTGDFTFVLYGEDGTGQIINQNGITASAVSDGLIVNDMINNNAAISGGKLDISSVIFEINNENDTAIHSSKIYLDEQNQSLEAAFNSLKTQVDTIVDISIDGDLKAFTEQIQSNTAKIEMNKSSINTLVSEDAIIRKEVSDLEGNLIETTNTLSSKYSSLEQNMDGFKLEVADVYAKKSTVKDLENNLATNYTTTEAMNSAITQNATQIATTVARDEIQNIQVGGTNLLGSHIPIIGLHNIAHIVRTDATSFEVIGHVDNDGTVWISNIIDGNGWYTISFDVKCQIEGWDVDVDFCHGETKRFNNISTTDYTHCVYSYEVTNYTSDTYHFIDICGLSSQTFWFKNIKVERGKIATDYSPCPSDYSTTTQMNSVIQQKADSITSTVSKIETSMAIDNLLANGNFTNGLNNWTYHAYGYDVGYSLSTNTYWTMAGKTALLLQCSNHPQGVDSGLTQVVNVKRNTDYTFTGYVASHRAEGLVIIKDAADNWLTFDKTDPDSEDYTGTYDITKWKRIRIVINSGERDELGLHLAMGTSRDNGHVWFHDFMVTEGNTDLCWKPSERETRTQINQLADRITSAVSSVEMVDGRVNQTQTQIDQLSDRIKSEVSKIETSMAIDNLLANGNFTDGLENWEYWGHGSSTNYTLTTNTEWTMAGKTALLLQCSNHPTGHDSGFTQFIDVKPNTVYTFTGYIASHRAEGLAIVKEANGTWLVSQKTSPDDWSYAGGYDVSNWKRIRIVINSGEQTQLRLHLAIGTSYDNGCVWFHDFMVTEGDTDLCWKPSERETRTQIDQLADRITATVSSVEMVNGKVNQANSDIGILADRITSTVSSIQSVDGKVNKAQSQIDQQANQIASKVSTGDLSSLIQQNSSSIYTAISSGRGANGVGIDMSGLYLFNNNLVTARLYEGKIHAYNSWNGNHMGYFGTNGDDLRVCLYNTNTFSVYASDTALLFKARYERDASYGNATLDMCGGINFIHKPGQDVGVNQIVLGNDDRADAYGYHNLSIRAHNSLGFMDNYGLTHMYFATRTGSIVMKGTVYQNSQSGISTFSLLRSREVVNDYGYTTEDMVNSILTLETSVNVDENEDYSMRICSSENELVTKILGDSLHIDQGSVIAGLVETVKSLNNRILELESELKK